MMPPTARGAAAWGWPGGAPGLGSGPDRPDRPGGGRAGPMPPGRDGRPRRHRQPPRGPRDLGVIGGEGGREHTHRDDAGRAARRPRTRPRWLPGHAAPPGGGRVADGGRVLVGQPGTRHAGHDAGPGRRRAPRTDEHQVGDPDHAPYVAGRSVTGFSTSASAGRHPTGSEPHYQARSPSVSCSATSWPWGTGSGVGRGQDVQVPQSPPSLTVRAFTSRSSGSAARSPGGAGPTPSRRDAGRLHSWPARPHCLGPSSRRLVWRGRANLGQLSRIQAQGSCMRDTRIEVL